MSFFGDFVYGGDERFLNNFRYPHYLANATFYFSFFSIYLLNYCFFCPKLLSKKNILQYAFSLLFMFFLFAGIRYLLEEVIGYRITGYHNYPTRTRTFIYYVFDNSYYALKAILFSVSLYLIFRYNENRNKIHELHMEQKKAEMHLLRTQLEPHFLFNTLNAIYTELVEAKSATAKSIYRLSELLRYVTYEANKDFTFLKDELKFIDEYIYFYQKRFESNLFLDFNLSGEVNQQKIPSLIIIHFIENIFKHGLLNKKDDPALINIAIDEKHIVIDTRNSISKGHNYTNKGIGKENLTKRLQLLYGNDYKLTSKKNEKYFEAYLKIPITH